MRFRPLRPDGGFRPKADYEPGSEYLALVTRSRTLFATYYHELTALRDASDAPGLALVNLRGVFLRSPNSTSSTQHRG